MSIDNNTDVTPDSLMASFKGMSILPILIFTLVVHVVVLFGSSVPYVIEKVKSFGAGDLTEAEKLELAVEETKSAMQKIAKKHDLSAQDVSERFGSGARPAAATTAPVTPEPEAAPVAETNRVRSSYETNLEARVEGPTVPTFEDDEDDLFD